MGLCFRWFSKLFGGQNTEEKSLEKILGFKPNNIEFYKLALIHRSASFISPTGELLNNERLEFLGDAVLGLTLAEYLYLGYPFKTEGDLTKLRARYVNGKNLEYFSKEIGLDRLIVTKANIHKSVHISGDAVEALIGAIYLDRGMEYARNFILNRYVKTCDQLQNEPDADYNYKGEIIEWCQHHKLEFRFHTVQNSFPKNSRPFFSTILYIDNSPAGCGFGASKKIAEQAASREALYACRY